MDEVDQSAGRRFFSEAASKELNVLNTFYKRHVLRYGDLADFSMHSANLNAEHLHRELVDSLLDLNRRFAGVERDA